MKRILLCMFLVVLLVCNFVSCDADDETSKFNADKVTFLSAYTEAERLGFEGTLEEFIALISGEDGAPGKDGVDGKDGAPGKDGTPGKDGIDGTTPTVEISDDGYWVINGDKTTVKAKGEKGDSGSAGAEGAQGVGVKSVAFDTDGNLLITFTDDSTQTVEIPKKDVHKHEYGAWSDFSINSDLPCEERFFYRACECNVVEFKKGTYNDHNFETVTIPPTCISGGYDTRTCSICGNVEKVNPTDISDHTWKLEYSHDNSFHWFDCEYCDATNGYEEHTPDDSGYCTVCDEPTGATEGVLYDLSEDGTYAMVIGYVGNSKKINIADTYKGFPVEAIYNNAFYNCNIESITIPNSIKRIEKDAFYGCSNLSSVHITDIVSWCGISFATDGYEVVYKSANPLYYAEYLYLNGEIVTNLVIPDAVTSIPGYLFYNCDTIKSVTIGKNVFSIGDYAFQHCSNLTCVTIGEKIYSIGNYAFDSCSSLTDVSIKGTAVIIGKNAFESCNSALYTEYEYGRYIGDSENPYVALIEIINKNFSTYKINENTKFISSEAFSGCQRMNNMVVPDNVTSIGKHAFSECNSLEKITVGDNLTMLGYSALPSNVLAYNEYNNAYYLGNEKNPFVVLVAVSDRDSVGAWGPIHENTRIIYSHAFYSCSRSGDLTIPDNIISIGDYAFQDCERLYSVVIGEGVKIIGKGAFLDCSYLKSVSIGDSVTSIERSAFKDCYNLQNMTLGENIVNIGDYAFRGCSRLTSITIPNSIISIGNYAFASCSRLSNFKFPESLVNVGIGALPTKYSRDGAYICFGEYPQTLKANYVSITETVDYRGYYLGSDGYYYAKVIANPKETGYIFSSGTDIENGEVYWFKVEPIRWRILTEKDGKALIMCDSIMINMAYDSDCNIYYGSDIRSWLLNEFYSSAFSEYTAQIIETTNVINDANSTGYVDNPYICDNTRDSIFLLSYSETIDSDYGFSTSYSTLDSERMLLTSDYARALGAWMSIDSNYYGYGYWWLRSPYFRLGDAAQHVNYQGLAGKSDFVYDDCVGVVPAMWITLA